MQHDFQKLCLLQHIQPQGQGILWSLRWSSQAKRKQIDDKGHFTEEFDVCAKIVSRSKTVSVFSVLLEYVRKW